MSPKQAATAIVAALILIFALQRIVILGLVGLEGLIVSTLVTIENAIFAAFFSTTKLVSIDERSARG